MNNSITSVQQILQISSQTVLGIVIISTFLMFGWFLFVKNQKANSDSSKNSVAIKISRDGKYKYEVVPDSDNKNLKFWIGVIIAIIALMFLWIPMKSIFNTH